ncbi:acyl-CoA dehydrogenase [Tersicoccus solisilvae]|uniref:Acyl-CoA dehydrogenase n=1 Tax=Tersicoccus solisilvae TaxID=1882339 RepID=A0ABQ1PLI2_9MICC|nr:acyl-CoA dehydrogenase [Tersicoccus solisilvae]
MTDVLNSSHHGSADLSTAGLSEELADLAAMVRDFADQVVAPAAVIHDAAHTFPYEVVAQMGELGLFGLPVPEEYDGMGGDHLALGVAIEELARVDQSIAITLEAAVSLGISPLLHYGTDEQKAAWVPDLAAGRALAGFGLTEPEAGSDASGTRTTARLEDGQWVINGSKEFITNSGTDITRLVTVTAVTGTGVDRKGRERKEISTLLVPVPTAGFRAEKAYDKVGWNSSDTHPLTLTDVRVPEANLLGERGRGYANFVHTLDEGRIAIAALGTGAAQGCLDASVRYAKERRAFGSAIGHHQAIAFKIARMQVRVHTARLAWRDAAARMVAGKPFKTQASIAKIVAGEAAMDNARDATQIFGGYGFINEFVVARHYRDSKILEIGEGTTEVQQMLIARSLGLE